MKATMRMVGALLALLAAAAFLSGGSPVAASAPEPVATAGTTGVVRGAEPEGGCVPGAVIVNSPNRLGRNELFGVTAISANDAWAVGSYYSPTIGTQLTLIERWNGTSWTQVPSPNVAGANQLNAVDALGPNDVWAVGFTLSPGGGYGGTLIQHWNGTSWSTVPSPNPGAQYSSSVLNGVTVVSPTEAWAVGSYSDGALILRWNGSAWTHVPPPSSGGTLYAVDALAANDVWAVGGVGGQYPGALALRWNGSTWSAVPTNTPGTLYAVDARAANDVWAVGTSSGQFPATPLAVRWNGSAWTQVGVPAPAGAVVTRLRGVVAISPTEAWAVGFYSVQSFGYETYESSRALILRWDGSAWSIVPGAQPAMSKLLAVSEQAGSLWAVGGVDSPQVLIERFDGSAWRVVPGQNPGRAHNTLIGVEAISPTDTWAVGYYDTHETYPTTYRQKTLIQHWDGTRWSIVPSPNAQIDENLLNDVWAASANDVWAVGMRGSGGDFWTMTQHWNGQQWTIVDSPNVGTYNPNYLEGVSGTGPNDVWAAGFMLGLGSSQPTEPLLLHWNGSAWSVVPGPSLGGMSGFLRGIHAIAPNNVWAVGSKQELYGPHMPLVIHWDGQAWSTVTLPAGVNLGTLTGVSASGAGDVWAVGEEYVGPGNTTARTMALHWNGTAWSLVDVPDYGTSSNTLTGVVALSPTSAWASGYFQGGTMIQHWNGAVWSIVSVEVPGQLANFLFGIDATSDADVWAVGSYGGGVPSNSLIEHVGPFSDVAPGEFYSIPIAYLAQRGVVSGYDDCTFRPGQPATRGQVAKMVVLAEGWALLDPAVNTFADVPRGSTFYGYIEALYARGAIGGYPCGGPGEPCGAGNKPYFRPNANITRAQLAKVMVLAEGWALANPATATFADVPAGSPFFRYVETARQHNLITGYPCGSPEPCDAQNRAVYRPHANATRGQIAKIIYYAITQLRMGE